jgi:hypothetical protein
MSDVNVTIAPPTVLNVAVAASTSQTITLATGAPGPAGADSSVTSENIISALGYTPVSKDSVLTDATAFDSAGAASAALATATTRAIAFSIAL